MKYLLVIVVVWLAFIIWRNNRRREVEQRPAPPPAAGKTLGAPQAMVRCAHCGLHLPATDALPGKDDKVYCSAAHRQADQ
ncbi:PP0621 family protein [Variovorax sp. OV329]|uniref:PP0621 family protein n=1 Tax=Variovorax sp. OV329 TaxID=1882825 RepID=UPI000B855738|nr:PP0621 family protein [Variovorax sp. OV329]